MRGFSQLGEQILFDACAVMSSDHGPVVKPIRFGRSEPGIAARFSPSSNVTQGHLYSPTPESFASELVETIAVSRKLRAHLMPVTCAAGVGLERV